MIAQSGLASQISQFGRAGDEGLSYGRGGLRSGRSGKGRRRRLLRCGRGVVTHGHVAALVSGNEFVQRVVLFPRFTLAHRNQRPAVAFDRLVGAEPDDKYRRENEQAEQGPDDFQSGLRWWRLCPIARNDLMKEAGLTGGKTPGVERAGRFAKSQTLVIA